MKKIAIGIVLFLLGINFLLKRGSNNKRINLRFNKDGEFTILQITDLHYGQNEENDARNLAIQEKLLDYVKPDIAILTGDMVHGQDWDGVEDDFF